MIFCLPERDFGLQAFEATFEPFRFRLDPRQIILDGEHLLDVLGAVQQFPPPITKRSLICQLRLKVAAVEYLLQTPIGLRIGTVIESADVDAPELLDAEVLAVLRREVLAGRLAERRATQAVADLRDWDVERLRPQSAARCNVDATRACDGLRRPLRVGRARP